MFLSPEFFSLVYIVVGFSLPKPWGFYSSLPASLSQPWSANGMKGDRFLGCHIYRERNNQNGMLGVKLELLPETLFDLQQVVSLVDKLWEES